MYPNSYNSPMKEDKIFKGKIESSSIAYAVAKMSGLQMCQSYNKENIANKFITVIPNTIVGPNDNFNLNQCHVLSALIYRMHLAKILKTKEVILWGNGEAKREFIYSDDLARACLLLLKSNPNIYNSPFNIGMGKDYSIKELAFKIKKIINFKGKIKWDTTKPNGAKKKLLDSRDMRQLGWRPKYNIEESIKKTYQWFLKKNH